MAGEVPKHQVFWLLFTSFYYESINFEKMELKSPIKFVKLPMRLGSFLLLSFEAILLDYIFSWWFFLSTNPCCSKAYVFGYYIVTPAFFWLIFVCNVFLKPTTLLLPFAKGYFLWYSKLSVSSLVVPDSLQPHVLQLTRLLCPWGFPDKDTGVGCPFLLQRIFLTQGSNLGPWTAGRFFTNWATREALLWCKFAYLNSKWLEFW